MFGYKQTHQRIGPLPDPCTRRNRPWRGKTTALFANPVYVQWEN